MLVAAVIARHQVLATVLGPGDRAAQPAGEPGDQHEFRAKRHLLAEPAAHIRRDDAKTGFRDSDRIGDGGAHEMGHLGRAGERDAAIGRVIGGVRGARLQRRGVLAARADCDLHAARCRGRHRIEAGRPDAALDDHIAAGAAMHQRRIVRQRRQRIDERRRLLDRDGRRPRRYPPRLRVTAPPPRRSARRRTARHPRRGSAGRSAHS